jgi:hypothetical protein
LTRFGDWRQPVKIFQKRNFQMAGALIDNVMRLPAGSDKAVFERHASGKPACQNDG